MCLVLLHCLDEDQALTQSKDSSNANAKAKNCRGLIQKRAHTLDDFMTGKLMRMQNQKFKEISSVYFIFRFCEFIPFFRYKKELPLLI